MSSAKTPRAASSALLRLARGFPVIALTVACQSSKTTLAKAIFIQKPYVSLKNPDQRKFASTHPKRFLAQFPDGAIIDEVQRVPAQLSWLQQWVEDRQRIADFVLAGSA